METQPRPLTLVTGASSGIGLAFAERFAADGNDLIIVARRRDRLTDLQQRLGSSHGVSVTPLVADLSTEAGMDLVESAVADPRLATLVDCAALAQYMSFLDLPTGEAANLVKLDVLAPVRLIRAALPGMVARGHGTVITIASLLAFSAAAEASHLPRRAVYAASKAFLVTFIRLVAAELAESGVKLQVVCPGIVRTEFHTRQNMDMSGRPRLEPEQVVEASLAGLELGEIVCIPTVDDMGKLVHHDQSEADLFMAGTQPSLAARYRNPAARLDDGSAVR